jgi:hypothetical protein
MEPVVRNISVRERIVWFEVQKLERRQLREAAHDHERQPDARHPLRRR